jgi:hypothetical protein
VIHTETLKPPRGRLVEKQEEVIQGQGNSKGTEA